MEFHNKFTGNGLKGINNNSLVNSPFVNNQSSGIKNNWAKWNGSADIPFSPQGASYSTNNNSIATIQIDSSRFLLIAGSDAPTVVVGRLVGNDVIYGFPAYLDTDINAAAWFRGLKISNGKIYIYYSWYNGTQNLAYAIICNIDASNNITFGTRSAQIGVSLPLSSPTPSALALSVGGHPVHGYRQSDSGDYYLVTSTINVDDTITINTIKNLGVLGFYGSLSCQNPAVLFLFLDYTFYVIQVLDEIDIGDIVVSTQPYPQALQGYPPVSIASIGLNQCAVLYNRTDEFTEAALDGARIVTYDESNETLSVGAETVFSEAICVSELIKTGNTSNQLIAVITIFTPNDLNTNSFACCLTPSGSSLISAPLYPVNANLNTSTDTPYNNQGAVLDANTIILPFITYNNANYGTTVLIRENALSSPEEIIHLEADSNVTTNPQPSLGNTTATINSHILGIISPNNYDSVLLPGTKLLVNGADVFTVVSANFTGAITNVITVEATGSYSNVDCSLLGVQVWFSSIESGDVTFEPFFSATQIPSLGQINNEPSIIFYSTNTDAYLECTDFSFPMSINATLFMVCKTIGTGDVLCSFKSANITPLADVSSQTVLVYPPNISVGTYDLTGGLTLLSLVRQNGNTRVYINGVLNETLTDNYAALAIGDPVVSRLGNNFAATNFFNGYLSALSLWNGALSDTARAAEEAYYFAKYSISP